MIEVQSVTKKFAKFLALESISFEARQGEVLGLLGENGAGKTTTLRLISTSLKPTSGSIKVAGIDVVKNPYEARKKIGMLFGGETGLYERLTARENIAYFGQLYGYQKREINHRIDQLSEKFGMDGYINRKVGGFSKGMKQKVAIARSLIHDPEIILFDEPTSGLDITSANTIRQVIMDFKQEGKTVIFSSHIMGEVDRLCDRLVAIHKGKVCFEGSIEEIYNRYQHQDLDSIFTRLVGSV
ncbi:ABC transporter ATP-binding protein [Paenibacillus sp. IHBB 10380]|uniref:ABC transporter ATP-binding protein n=1 Tax=Paenibacillus sp. IHBB 10380 TaxID=1566358 RepID=UPI0005CFE16F|nr:ATP-binding cassette domain-containing protein [Paenibacillus sp. IHBB 10380]AJS58362.1 hypothetical protein UB51_07460 [Paenibacillus sp. IHBB 10380]